MMKKEFMAAAIEEARKGIHNGHGGPFGAVIVKDNQIVGRGHNEVIHNQDPTCHGEMMAIHDACKNLGTFDLKGCELYTTGYPCPMCFGAILWANIAHVYYGCNVIDTEEKIGFRDNAFYEMLDDEKKMKAFCEELSREECLALYEEYAKIGGEKY